MRANRQICQQIHRDVNRSSCRHAQLDFGWRPPVAATSHDEQDLEALTAAWCSQELSNYDYLMHLNRLAGRRDGDRNFQAFLPW